MRPRLQPPGRQVAPVVDLSTRSLRAVRPRGGGSTGSGNSNSTRPARSQQLQASSAASTTAAVSEAGPVAVQADATTANQRSRRRQDAAATAAATAAAERESLQLLEWPALCRQVACFAQTPMGAELALRCALPVGRSPQESQQLLQQTAEAQRAQLSFKGVYDIRRAVDAAEQQQREQSVLHPLVLGAVATTLAAAQRLQDQLQGGEGAQAHGQGQQQQGQGQGKQFGALLELAAGIGDALPQLRRAIEQCIQPEEGRILDSASPALAEVRQQRRDNRATLRAEMERWARQMHAQGVSERPQVVVRRDRLCIPVRSGRQGELPKGSVCLATSASGSTLYMEPKPVVALNNAEMALAGREVEEETAVLLGLTDMVAQHAQQLRSLLSSITALDIASARGRHASWLGAATPPRFLTPEEAAEGGPVQLPRAWHPLLLQPCLPPLPTPPLPEEMREQQQWGQDLEAQTLSGPLAGLSLVPELAAAATPKPVGEVGSSTPRRGAKGGEDASQSGNSSSSSSKAPKLPQPVDLTIPPGVTVVAVTGPNTGGKTASLKALGLQCLMAKAGLFLPQAPPAAPPQHQRQQQQQQQQQPAEGSQPPHQPEQQQPPPPQQQAEGPQQLQQQGQEQQALLWFDRVLADLGDGQSLQQSLSTFSGHVRRIRNVLAAATPQSLVLLDEVGSGTDPAEGAALAAALLERLQQRAALTYATTHHAELKELAASAQGFVNASVEFDVGSLRPSYRLMWGAAGESNALAVAQGLGFAPPLVAAAREVAQQLHHSSQHTGQRAQLLQESLQEQLGEARQAAAEAAAARAAAEAAATSAQQELGVAREQQVALGREAAAAKGAGAEVQRRVQRLVADVRAGRLGTREAEEQLRVMEREAAPPEAAAVQLMGLRAAAQGGGAGLAAADDDAVEGSGWMEGGSSSADGTSAAAAAGWVPAEGEEVRVLKMGGAVGRVVSGGARAGGKVSVRVGVLTVELRLADLAPAKGPQSVGAQQAAVGAARRQRGASTGSSTAGSLKAAAKQLRARGTLASDDDVGGSGSSGGGGLGVAIQTSRNTVDVRGQRADEAEAEVQSAVMASPSGWALFVVHGVGTGRVRAAVLGMLRRHPRVAKMEEAEASNGGCTVVYIK